MAVSLGPEVRLRGTIVVAEDDLATRMLLRRVLTRANFKVTLVENGRLACDAIHRERPDLVLLDWAMPVMDGKAVIVELKANPETHGIPIVMLMSQGLIAEKVAALEAGAGTQRASGFSFSISTASRRSTTRTDTQRATSCSRQSPWASNEGSRRRYGRAVRRR